MTHDRCDGSDRSPLRRKVQGLRAGIQQIATWGSEGVC